MGNKKLFPVIYITIFVLVAAAVLYYGISERQRVIKESDRSLRSTPEELFEDSTQPFVQPQPESQEDTAQPGDVSVNEASAEEIVVGADTIYRVETYDTYTHAITADETSVPAEFIGMGKKDLEQYLDTYIKDIPLAEFEKGLLSCELMDFNKERITVRKTYDGSSLKYRFFVVLEKGCVTVYYSDKKTVYEYTEIYEEDLPSGEAEKLREGIYAEDEEHMYGILESLTS